MDNDKWKLNIGCHRYTITSRDSEVREFDTEQEAIQSWQDSRKSYRSIGYVVWFAILTDPQGNTRTLESNPCTGC